MSKKIILLLKRIRIEASLCDPNWAKIQGDAGEAWGMVEKFQLHHKILLWLVAITLPSCIGFWVTFIL